jgi:choline dehydrogenase-like flavoprotein
LPLLTVRNYWGGNSDLLHTLSQIFLECVDDEVSSHNIHMQLYTYSDMFKIALDQMGFGARLLTSLFRRQLLGRLLVIQGYLHSDDSSTISMSLGKGGVLRLVGNQSLRGGQVVRRLMAKLLRVLPFSGVIPLVPMLKVGLPGEGRHAGGAFPMSATPGPLEVDVSCRPAGLRHVHVVDASVFPTVPAATITLTAMANAYRVGKSVATE